MSGEKIPYARPSLTEEDIQSVVDVLRTPMISRGLLEIEFEDRLKEFTGAPHAITCNSGSSALFLAYKALGVNPSSTVWTTPLSFVSTASAALHLGAKISFVDIDDSWNMSLDALRSRLQKESPPDVLTVVSFAGNAANSLELWNLSQKFGFKLILDQSHALGADYRVSRCKHKVGCCLHADVEILSFQAVKNVTTGEGGAVLCRDSEIADRVRLLRNNGIHKSESMKSYEYDIVEEGFNMRMTELQSALGISQMNRIHKITEERRQIALEYDKELSGLKILGPPGDRSTHAFHIYPILIDDRDRILEELKSRNIFAQAHYIPIYRHSVFARNMGDVRSEYPNTESYFEKSISLPMFNGLDELSLIWVINQLREIL